jgi:hypothetical protein
MEMIRMQSVNDMILYYMRDPNPCIHVRLFAKRFSSAHLSTNFGLVNRRAKLLTKKVKSPNQTKEANNIQKCSIGERCGTHWSVCPTPEGAAGHPPLLGPTSNSKGSFYPSSELVVHDLSDLPIHNLPCYLFVQW